MIAIVGSRESQQITSDDVILKEALFQRGAASQIVVWDDASVDWRKYDLAVIRTTWDYHLRLDEFLEWVELASQQTRLFNPPEIIKWNSHKGYLSELSHNGVSAVDTVVVSQDENLQLQPIAESKGWETIIVKPAVASTAYMAKLFKDADWNAAQSHLETVQLTGDALMQPFMSSVLEIGEVSVICVDGRLTHSVRKRAKAGDFRVQHDHGGTYYAQPATQEEIEVAQKALAATPTDVVFGRVDLVNDQFGNPLVSELELIEPELFFGVNPSAAERLAECLLRHA